MASRRILEKNKYQFLEKIRLSPMDEESQDYSAEIDNYLKDLKTYKVPLMGLSKDVPSKEDRNLFLNLALIINDDEKLKEQFTTQKKLPLKIISKRLEVPLFKLEVYENYLCAYTLLLDKKYPLLSKTLTYGPRVKEHLTEVLKHMPQGIVLHSSFRHSYLLTRHGEFYRVKNEGHEVGQFASGRKKRNPLKWKKPLGFILIIALFSFGFYQYQTNQVQNTIIIRAVGEVKVEFNSFGNLIDILGTNPVGDKFVSSAEFEGKDMDTVLAEIIEQAYISGTIKERDELLIIISGDPLEENFFKEGKTHDRILSYQLNPKINNDGSFLDVK